MPSAEKVKKKGNKKPTLGKTGKQNDGEPKAKSGKKKGPPKGKKKTPLKTYSPSTVQLLLQFNRQYAGYGTDGKPDPQTMYATPKDLEGPSTQLGSQLVYFHLCQVNWEYSRIGIVLTADTPVFRLKCEIAQRALGGSIDPQDIVIIKRTIKEVPPPIPEKKESSTGLEGQVPFQNSRTPSLSFSKPESGMPQQNPNPHPPSQVSQYFQVHEQGPSTQTMAKSIPHLNVPQGETSGSKDILSISENESILGSRILNTRRNAMVPVLKEPRKQSMSSSFSQPRKESVVIPTIVPPMVMYNFQDPDSKVSSYDEYSHSSPHHPFPFHIPRTSLCMEGGASRIIDCFPDLTSLLAQHMETIQEESSLSAMALAPADMEEAKSSGNVKSKKVSKKGGGKSKKMATVLSDREKKEKRRKYLQKVSDQKKAKANIKQERIRKLVDKYKYDPIKDDVYVMKPIKSRSHSIHAMEPGVSGGGTRGLQSSFHAGLSHPGVPFRVEKQGNQNPESKLILPDTQISPEEAKDLPTYLNYHLLLRTGRRDLFPPHQVPPIHGPHLPHSAFLHFMLLPRPGMPRSFLANESNNSLDDFGLQIPFEQLTLERKEDSQTSIKRLGLSETAVTSSKYHLSTSMASFPDSTEAEQEESSLLGTAESDTSWFHRELSGRRLNAKFEAGAEHRIHKKRGKEGEEDHLEPAFYPVQALSVAASETTTTAKESKVNEAPGGKGWWQVLPKYVIFYDIKVNRGGGGGVNIGESNMSLNYSCEPDYVRILDQFP